MTQIIAFFVYPFVLFGPHAPPAPAPLEARGGLGRVTGPPYVRIRGCELEMQSTLLAGRRAARGGWGVGRGLESWWSAKHRPIVRTAPAAASISAPPTPWTGGAEGV